MAYRRLGLVLHRFSRFPGHFLHWIVLPYALLLATTAGVATGLALQAPSFWPLALGAALFLFSDTLIGGNWFNNLDFPLVHDLIWLTYGPGQMLIVYSVGVAAGFVNRLDSKQPPNALDKKCAGKPVFPLSGARVMLDFRPNQVLIMKKPVSRANYRKNFAKWCRLFIKKTLTVNIQMIKCYLNKVDKFQNISFYTKGV